MKNYLLGCDWGTSSFRLRLIQMLGDDIAHHQLMGEVISQEGVASTYNAWKVEGEAKGISKNLYFRQQLKKQIGILSKKLSFCLDHITLVISGMASSSVGMEEVPYACLPFAVDGSQASIRHFEKQAEFPHDIILISGIKSPEDVMRGEETQLIGLVALADFLHNQPKAILIFPGTHSKHIYIKNSQLINFRTFMTGEVFNLMVHHSILKDSVDSNDLSGASESDLEAFKLGVRESSRANVLHSLFKVRTNQLFGKLNRKQNSLYLSGLLIGAELKQLGKKENGQIVLCSGSNLFAFYQLAIEELHLSGSTITIAADLIDKAAMAGQIRIFKNQKLKTNNNDHQPI